MSVRRSLPDMFAILPAGHVRRRAAIGGLLLVAAISSGCGADDAQAGAEGDRVTVVTSTNVYGAIASTVGADQVDVTAFVSSPSQDPHSFEANTRNIVTVAEAEIVIENGGGYDDFMDQLLASASGDPTVLNAVDLSGLTATAGDELNEHVWYDLPTMQRVATALAEALSEVAPEHAETFTRNARRLSADLQDLIDREAQLKKTLDGSTVGITEPVPGYMIEALGLVNLTPDAFSEAVEEGEDVSVSVLDETLSLYTDHRVDALVYNEQTTGAITEQVKQAADDAGIPIVAITETLPEGETYLMWMKDNLHRLREALQAS